MSGCCGPSPVVIQGPAPSRVDVETLLLCDVLPDGTVAATVLVEPVYDTTSGDRVGTRTVDPVTGAAYTVQGELQQCPAASTCPDCQTHILCDTEEITTSTAPITVTGYQVRDDQLISGAPRRGTDADAEAIWTGQTVSVPGAAPGGSDAGAHTHYGGILGLGEPACGDLDPAGTVEITATVTYTNDGPGDAWDWYGRLSMWDGTTLLPGVDNFGGSSGVFFTAGSTRTATITNTVPVASVLAGNVTIEFDLETGSDGGQPDPKSWTVTAGSVAAGPVPVTACPGGPVTQFMRHICRACNGTATITDTELDGTTPYTVQGTVGVCPVESPCASPTTPVTTVGLCLADGTPIAVTVVRDCDGLVTSEGWLNLSTGAWTAGAVPVGTVACGDSRSIQVSGTFCDIDAAGEVVGLVLVEYTYDDTGAISDVRLVDAVTGGTYTPTGTVTVCPAGVEQPEQDAVILCHTAADGTVTQFVRDYRRDENGAITAHSDYTLDGAPYVPPAGTVGVCAAPCLNCETVELCDSAPAPVALSVTATPWACRYVIPADFAAGQCNPPACRINNPDDGAAFFNGGTVIFPNRAEDPDCGNTGTHLGIAGVVQAAVDCPECYSDGDQFTVTVSGQSTNDGPGGGIFTDGRVNFFLDEGQPDGTIPQLVPQAVDSNRGPNSTWDWTLSATISWADLKAGKLVVTLDHETKANGAFKQWTAENFVITAVPAAPKPGCGHSFRRTICRDCSGAIVSTTDYEPDGVTPYTPVEPVGACVTCQVLTMAEDCEVIQLCDVQHDVSAVLPSLGTPDEQWQTLPNGVRWMKRGNDTASGGGWYLAGATAPERFDVDRPVSIRYSVRFSGPTAAPLRIPDGWYLDSIVTVQHTWDAATRTISPTASATQAGESTLRIDAQTAQTMIAPVLVGTQPSGQTSQYGQITVTTDQATPFLRTLCRGADGTVTTTDTTLDGLTAYEVTGTEGTCPETPPASCTDCETLLLCDNGTDDPATITGQGVSSGTLTNGVAWTMRGSAAPIASKVNNADGAWFGKPESFPNSTIPPYTVTVDRPSTIEFSVYMLYRADWPEPDDNCMQLPQGVQPVYLPPGFVFDPVTSRVCVTAEQTGDPCTNLTNPTVAASARFRTNGPVTSLTTRFLGVRYALCGQFQSAWVGAYEVIPTGQFLRHVCRNCDGTVTSVRDTGLDGVTPYTPLGAVGQCEPDPVTCETLTLCDITPGPDQWAMVQGTATPETLSNGITVTWTRNIPAGAVYPDPNMRSWLPTASALTSTLSTSKPAQVRIGVSLGASQQLTLPPGTEVHTLSPHHSYNPATRVLTAAATSQMTGDESGSGNKADYITKIYVPRVAGSVAFTAASVGAGVGFDNIEAAPADPYPFLQTTCRSASGDVVNITSTRMDGVTPYTPLGTVGTCLPSDCCKPVQVCVDATATQSLEFISNAANATDNSVDPTWKWSPALAGPWYDMYRTPPVAGWITQDGGTPAGTAHWVAAHPNGSPVQSSPPRAGEGPTIGVQTWYARASFVLPSTADPESIRIAATVLNADQNLVQWRLNSGAWQPVGADHTEPPFTFGPTAVPGVQPGTNEMILEIQETVAGGGGAALMVHLIASYQLPDGQRSWTRMVCCDDTVYYLDETGERHEELPEFWTIAPCGASAEPLILCDDIGSFLRHVSYAGDQVVTTDTDLGGEAYTPTGVVRACAGSSGSSTPDQPVQTGIRRVTGTAAQALASAFPGLQSVSLAVLAGTVNVTMTDGNAQAVPAGVTLTWSVADTDDSSLALATFVGAAAGADYVLNWIYKGTVAG